VKKYEVIIHTRKGYRFFIDAEDESEAQDFAVNAFVESGEDGDEIVYEDQDYVDVTELTGN